MRWGLIGASTIAAEHVIGAIRAQGHQIEAVVSRGAARGADYAQTHGIAAHYSDPGAMLAAVKPDAVYISSTNEKHHAEAMAAIAAGCHVLCEKPLAMTVADAAQMVKAAADNGVTFATNHHLRNAGTHRAIREAIFAGRVGDVLSVRVFHAVNLPDHLKGWRINDAAAGGGVIVDITVHDADTVRFHLGEDPAEVVAQMASTGLGEGVEDSVMSVWRMPSGAMVQAHESFTHRFAGTGIEIHGTKGSIIARGVMTQAPGGSVMLVSEAGEEAIPFDLDGLYYVGLSRFAAAVAGEGAPAADGVDGVKSLAVALAVREAAASGRAVTVDYGGL
ncbi:MAG: Gfo/Idh/MocA family oxidoreductase [Pseudomonadota bacterium]